MSDIDADQPERELAAYTRLRDDLLVRIVGVLRADLRFSWWCLTDHWKLTGTSGRSARPGDRRPRTFFSSVPKWQSWRNRR
jgi:hypothetical protein